MIKFKDYLVIQYKRIFKLLPGITAMILVVAALLGAAGVALMYSDAYKDEQQRYKLGVVGDTDDEMISLGVYMIGTLDASRYMIELVEYPDEATAKDAMRAADISAYIVITEEFSDALNAMTNDSKLKYYATSGQKGISNVMMDEIAAIATNIIVYSETGICTLREVMKEQGFSKEVRGEKIDELFMYYIASLMTRTIVYSCLLFCRNTFPLHDAAFFLCHLLFLGTKECSVQVYERQGYHSTLPDYWRIYSFLDHKCSLYFCDGRRHVCGDGAGCL